ncbi:MAG: hypothetical protein ACI9TV_002668 [Sulfurimonas sp.]|jgi:hypothetical protein|uniref:hypothetical protein n=1 Tax=Sulfurimonas sp. TaxID=2022749 RepID=UPI0039E40F23
MINKELLLSRIQTPDGTFICSRSLNDLGEHTDKNGKYYGIEGGLAYQRIFYDKKDYIDASIYTTDDFTIIRENIVWDTYGIDGNDELKHVRIKDLELDHIENILLLPSLSMVFENMLLSEIEFRK